MNGDPLFWAFVASVVICLIVGLVLLVNPGADSSLSASSAARERP